jgi:hypothetical protein
LLDKVNDRQFSGATYLVDHGVTPMIDDMVKIAHNTVIVIDRREVITGSYKFHTCGTACER